MKRILAFVLAFVLCISPLGVTALAAGTGTIPLTISISEGSDNTITVTVVASEDFSFATLVANVAYDKTVFTRSGTGTYNSSYDMGYDSDTDGFMMSAKNATVDPYMDDVTSGTVLATYEFSYADDADNGEYEFTLTVTTFEDGKFKSLMPSDPTATATYTIGSTTPTAPYTATLSSTTTTVDNDGTSTVSVNVVVGGITGSFASTEIKLSYDPTYLTYSSGSCALTPTVKEGQTDQAVSISAANGVITIRDYGGNMAVDANGTTAYTVNFTTVKGGTTDVSLSSAGFSTLANAASSDLSYVTDTDSKVNVNINHKATVTVDDTAGTTTYVTPNGDYTYQISDYNATKYTYTVTATEDSTTVDTARISVSDTGLVTITGVKGELAVTIAKTANSYNIAWTDNENAITTTEKPTTQTYGTGITFDVKAGQAPNGTTDGWRYDVKAYLTSDTNKNPVTVTAEPSENVYAARTYTIAADDITGNITIEVTKVDVGADQTTITISGDYTELSKDGTELTAGTLNVTKNESVSLTLKKEDGYTYTVQTKVGEAEAQDVNVDENGSFTISVGNDALTLIVTKTLDTTSLEVSKYVQLDGKTMWLVKINGLTDTTNKTYTYKASDGAAAENFYWSGKYTLTGATATGAYCFLVITETNTDADSVKTGLAGKIGLTSTAATAISYNGNVNLTTDNGDAVIDVNDAQLVWNMYSAVYSEIDTNVTVQKFLEADMSGDGELGTDDAAAVVSKIN